MTAKENGRIAELNELFKTLNSNVGLLNVNVEKVLKDYDTLRVRSTEDLLATGDKLREYQRDYSALLIRIDNLIAVVESNSILLNAVPCIDAVKKNIKVVKLNVVKGP
jgi:hypothetical protein